MKLTGFVVGATVGAAVGAAVATSVLSDPKAYRTAKRCKTRAIKTMDNMMHMMNHNH